MEYQWDLKNEMKIEEDELMKLLNTDLKDSIMMYINGYSLRQLTFINEFSIEFISQLTFKMIKKTYTVAENIILVSSSSVK
jgi:hypothetical protein